jgi:ubiquinone/menaquinone biosynthesis C-methylase UbiE
MSMSTLLPFTTHRNDFYDRISRTYDLLAGSSERASRELGIRSLELRSGECVLEIGCGTGQALVMLADAVGPTGRVHGFDRSTGMLRVAADRLGSHSGKNVSLTMGNASALCFRSHMFDVVFMSFTLELFGPTIPAVLAEVWRVLRPGGRLGIVAMATGPGTNVMIELYAWAHSRWPQVVDCVPIGVVAALRGSRFQTERVATTAMWGLPVTVAIGTKAETK